MSTINYAEDLFEAISTIVEKRISNLEFDKTIICTIIDTSKAATQNLYTVTDGSVSFEVQSNGGIYAVNDQVRVSIVNGDFSKDKFIQGKYNAADATKPITYVSPLNSVVKITDNLLTGSNETHGIAANGNIKEIPVGEIIFDEDIQNKDLFDTLYLSAEFQTNFDQYKMQQGSYGLHVMFATEKNEREYDRLDIYFDIMDMFGNPYAFKIFTQQEIKYNFSEQLEGLVGAKIYLYQNNDFQYLSENGNKENYTPTEINENIISDIFVKNIIFGFGSEVTSISGRKLKLYTNDELKYRADGTEAEAVTKNLKLLWYNSDSNNMYVGFSDGEWIADDEGQYSYDEEDYLLAAAANTRLLSRKTEAYPDDEVSLGLAADIYDIKNEALKAYKLIGKDIKDLLKSFQSYTENAEWETEHPANALLATGSDADNSLATYAKSIEDTSTELKNLYNNILTQAKKIKKDEQKDFTDINFPTESDPHLNFAVDIDAVNNAVNAIFTTSDPILKDSAWDGVYTNYSNQWKILEGQLEKVKTNLNKYSGLSDDISNYEELKQILDNKASNISDTSYSDLTKDENFIKQWDNKYCLYWYRYTKDLIPKDRFMPAGWERINEFTNKGLPGRNDDTDYLQQKLSASESSIVSPDLRAQNEEKFKILLFYNHEQIQSNELIFENLIEFPDAATVNAAASIKINNKGDKTQDTYQLYNATGWLINAADAQVKRELIAEYDGAIGGNEKLIGHTIKWSVPKSATMIDIFDSEVNQFTIDDPEDESYIHYSKVIGADPNDETKVNEAHLVFPYHIKNYYQQTATRNTILCNVDTWYGAKSITFASFGTNGTDYTLVLLTNPQQPMVINDDKKPLNITTKLYDYENNEITLSEGGVIPEYSWEGPTGYKYDNEKGQITKDSEKSSIYAGILHCTTTIESKLKLSTQLTIPYGNNENYYIEGANSIIYDSNGGNPQYYKNPYRLYELGGEVENVTWSIIYYDKDGNEIKEESDTSGILKYVPRLVNNTLVPSIMYITPQDNNVIYPVVLAKQGEDTILWAQPIIITQNTYSSSLLNEWDGSLSIDKENGTILSTMVGAGRKNEYNEFEGVLMGDVATTSNDQAIITTGLYGFHKGAQSFGFKVDGTAFLGKSGGGRIEFDGNTGLIHSSRWLTSTQPDDNGNYSAFDDSGSLKSGTEGMAIDLNSGAIDAHNFKLTSDNFILSNEHISTTGTDMTNWYNNYVPTPEDENAEKGKIIFKANDLFAVTSNGYLFTDDIYANTKGQIGGWQIDGYRLLANEEDGIRHAGMAANSGHGCWAFWAGAQSGDGTEANPYGFDAPFHVGHAGELYCDNITATGGLIGTLQIQPDGSLSSEYLTISQNQVHFKTASSFQMTDDFSITNNITGSNNDAIIMQTFGTYKFYIQNAEGAGIVFHNSEVNEGSSTSLIIKNIDIVERVQGEESYTNIYYDIDYDFTFDYEWVNEVPVATEFPISITLQASRGQMRYPWGEPAYYEPKDYFENTVYYVIPVDPVTGFGQKSGSCSFTNVVHIDASGGDMWKVSGIRRTGTSDNFVSTGGSFTYHTSSASGKNDILYSIGSFAPLTGATDANTGYFLGDDKHFWNSVYAYTASITASDKRFKTNISNIADQYDVFYSTLRPVTYKYINGASQRTHTGFIAQEIEQGLGFANITTQDFAGLCICKNEDQHYCLRYEEFIPLNTWQIQKLKPRMTEAEERIYKLEQELVELKSKLI